MSRTHHRHVQPSDFRDKTDVRPYDRAAAKREADTQRREAMGELTQRPQGREVRR